MTWFGKILVLINLALSLGVLLCGVLVYTQRTDWSDQRGKEGRPDGELVRRKALVKEQWDLLPPPEYAWRTSRNNLPVLEEGTPPDRKDGRLASRAWYQAEIQHLLTGDDKNPPQEVVFDDKRRPAPDPNNFGRPTMKAATDRAGKPLLSLAAYDKREQDIFLALKTEQEMLKQAIEEDIVLTMMLLGKKELIPKVLDALSAENKQKVMELDSKGLQERLVDERIRRADVLAEQDIVKRPLINTYVEAELLIKRKRELEYRLEELKKARAARLAGLGKQ